MGIQGRKGRKNNHLKDSFPREILHFIPHGHFRHPGSQSTPSTWGIISEQNSLFGAGCFPFVTNCNGPYWELDVPTASLGKTFSLVARTVPLLSYGVWRSKIMNAEKDFAAFIRVRSWEAKQSRLCVKDVMLPGWFPCKVVQLHLCALLLYPQGAAAKWCNILHQKRRIC